MLWSFSKIFTDTFSYFSLKTFHKVGVAGGGQLAGDPRGARRSRGSPPVRRLRMGGTVTGRSPGLASSEPSCQDGSSPGPGRTPPHGPQGPASLPSLPSPPQPISDEEALAIEAWFPGPGGALKSGRGPPEKPEARSASSRAGVWEGPQGVRAPPAREDGHRGLWRPDSCRPEALPAPASFLPVICPSG